MPKLHPAFLQPPIAHRGLHSKSIPENSHAAFQAAITHGYGIELDIQMSLDGEAMVFHDYELSRLTAAKGPTRQHTAAELAALKLSDGSPAPTLDAVLKQVAGQVALLVEIKDQDGAMGDNIGQLEARVAELLALYRGPVAVMSLNPHAIYHMQRQAPNVARGLVTCAFSKKSWPLLPRARAEELVRIPDFSACGASFISHHLKSLDLPVVASIAAEGNPVLSWTIKSEEDERQARRIADNITFEGYLP
ncbi:MAG: phosphodiesterase [Rhodobacteraceae bacterium]|nr:phosphodiesterase [Paracoccaceae bacterium]